MEISPFDRRYLLNLIDTYSIQSVISALSSLCANRALYLEDPPSSAGWLAISHHLELLASQWQSKENLQ